MATRFLPTADSIGRRSYPSDRSDSGDLPSMLSWHSSRPLFYRANVRLIDDTWRAGAFLLLDSQGNKTFPY